MIFNICISRQKDIDLYLLTKKMGVKEFKEALKNSLRSLTGENINYKPLLDKDEEGTTLITISLTAKKDESVRELLNKVIPGQRSAFCKMALRLFLGSHLILPLFITDGEIKTSDNITRVQFDLPETPKPKKKKKKRQYTPRPQVVKPQPIIRPEIVKPPEVIPQIEEKVEEMPKDIPEVTPIDEESEVLSMLNGLLF